MSKAKFGATCAAVVLSCAFVSTQTISPESAHAAGQSTDKPLPNSDAAKSPHAATISGCVVRDAANGGQPTISSNGVAYQLTGKSDKDLQRYLGKRLEVTGTLNSGSTGARATSGKTDETTGAPKDQTAIPLATDKGTTADLTGRIQVKTVKMIAPNCL